MSLTAQVLRHLPGNTDPNLVVGADFFDDAGVYRLDDSTALVVTLDFFPPLVDEPYAFGQIAAANSLSDIYAMGGKPLVALNIVGFPDKKLPAELLNQILQGGAERVKKAGAALAGGHSVRDDEVKYGLSVTGIIHPDRIVANKGAKQGDVLVLSKPLGIGTLCSAAKTGKMPTDDLREAIEIMIDLNAGACEAMLEIGASATTDITGFGLIGHAAEMARASEVAIEIKADSVPLIPNTLKFAQQGVITRVHKNVLDHMGSDLSVGDVDETLVKLLADAQTSGGLLISVPEDRADELVKAMTKRKTKAASIIGRVVERSDALVSVC